MLEEDLRLWDTRSVDSLEPAAKIFRSVVDAAQSQIRPIRGPGKRLERRIALALHERRVARFEQLEHGRHVPRLVAKLERDTRALGHLGQKRRERSFVATRVRRQLHEQ